MVLPRSARSADTTKGTDVNDILIAAGIFAFLVLILAYVWTVMFLHLFLEWRHREREVDELADRLAELEAGMSRPKTQRHLRLLPGGGTYKPPYDWAQES